MIHKYSTLLLNVLKSFSLDGSQNDLVFQLILSYFTSKNDKIGTWYLKGMLEEIITPLSTTGNSFDPEINCN